MNRFAARAVTIIGLIASICASQGTADALSYDHLQCHKIKDGQKFNGVVLSLSAVESAFQVPANCDLVGKAAEICIPADKDVVDAGDAPVPSLLPPTQDLSDNVYLCYKVKCPAQTVADQTVTDQFGVRAIATIKTSKICVPAVIGAVTTTTTTITTSSTTTTSTTSTTTPPIVSLTLTPGGEVPAGVAAFGPQTFDVIGDVVVSNDSAAPTSDGCQTISNVAGKIALIDRGTCPFPGKVANAQNAGALAVIIADNATSDTPPAITGADPSISIPIMSVTQAVGQQMKADLVAGSPMSAHMVRQ
jgi:hypothetical protein